MWRPFARGLSALVFVTFILQVTACGSVQVNTPSSPGGGSNGPLRIAVIPKAIGFAFWESVHQGALCAASKLQNVHVQWDGVTAETDVTPSHCTCTFCSLEAAHKAPWWTDSQKIGRAHV